MCVSFFSGPSIVLVSAHDKTTHWSICCRSQNHGRCRQIQSTSILATEKNPECTRHQEQPSCARRCASLRSFSHPQPKTMAKIIRTDFQNLSNYTISLQRNRRVITLIDAAQHCCSCFHCTIAIFQTISKFQRRQSASTANIRPNRFFRFSQSNHFDRRNKNFPFLFPHSTTETARATPASSQQSAQKKHASAH